MNEDQLRPTSRGEVAVSTRSFIRAPVWVIAGPPTLALLLLIWVELAGVNQQLFHYFNNLPAYTGPAFWAHVTILGDGLVCATLLLLWIRRHPHRVWGGLLGAVFMVVILYSFKIYLNLPRPWEALPGDLVTLIGGGPTEGSFPSGHTATIALFTGLLALTTERRIVPLLALSMAILVGISRMAVGVHWPADVLAGFALGWTSAWLGLRWAPRAPWGMKPLGRRVQSGAILVAALVLLLLYDTEYPGVFLLQKSLALVCLTFGILGLVTGLEGEGSERGLKPVDE